MMKRVWLDSYTEGAPHEIDPDTYPCVVAVIDEAIAVNALTFTAEGKRFG